MSLVKTTSMKLKASRGYETVVLIAFGSRSLLGHWTRMLCISSIFLSSDETLYGRA